MRVFVLLLMAGVAFGQPMTFTPQISTKGIASVITRPGSDTIAATAKPFAALQPGMPLWGVGVPYGTTVEDTLFADSLYRISEPMTQGGTKVVHFGYYTNTTYASGDWIGWPVEIFPEDNSGYAVLVSASVTDSTDGIGNVDIVFFQSYEDSAGTDSIAAVWPKRGAAKLFGVVSLTTTSDLGSSRVNNASNLAMVLPKNNLFFRLLAKAAYGPTLTTTPIKVHLNFLE